MERIFCHFCILIQFQDYLHVRAHARKTIFWRRGKMQIQTNERIKLKHQKLHFNKMLFMFNMDLSFHMIASLSRMIDLICYLFVLRVMELPFFISWIFIREEKKKQKKKYFRSMCWYWYTKGHLNCRIVLDGQYQVLLMLGLMWLNGYQMTITRH